MLAQKSLARNFCIDDTTFMSLDHLYIGEDLDWPSPAMPGATRQKIKDADQGEVDKVLAENLTCWVNFGEYETLGRNSLASPHVLGERFDFLKKLLGIISHGKLLPNQGKKAIIKILIGSPSLNKTDWKNDIFAG